MESESRDDLNIISDQFAWVFESLSLKNSKFYSLTKQLRSLEPNQQEFIIDEIWTVFVFNLTKIKKIKTLLLWHQELKSLNFSQDSRRKINIEIKSKADELLSKIPSKLKNFEFLQNFELTLKQLEKLEEAGFDVTCFVEIFLLKFMKFVEKFESGNFKVLEILKSALRFNVLDGTQAEVFNALSRLGAKGHDKVISIGLLVGQTTFSSIRVLKHEGIMDQNRKVMIWRYFYSNANEDFRIISKEMENLEKIENANKHYPLFIDMLAIYFDTEEMVVVQEYLPCTLKDFIEQSGDPGLIISSIPKLLQSYAYALSNGIIHGSITPESIFYDTNIDHAERESYTLKINFVGSVLSRSKCLFNSLAAPEVFDIKSNQSDLDFEKTDVYSLGMVLLQSLTSFRIREMKDFNDVYKFIIKIPGPEWIQDVVSFMLRPAPDERADFKTLLSKIPGILTTFT